MSGILGALVSNWLDRQNQEADRQRRQEAINRAAAMLGFTGAGPTDEEINRKLAGENYARPDLQALPDAQKDSEYGHLKALREAEVANAGNADLWKTGAMMKEAGYPAEEFQKSLRLQKLGQVLNQLNPRLQVDALNDKALGDPYTLNGGVTANKETGEIVDESSAQRALALLRGEQANTEASQQGAYRALAGLRGEQVNTEKSKQQENSANALALSALEKLRQAQTGEQTSRTSAADRFGETGDTADYTRATGRLPPPGKIFKGSLGGKGGMFQMGPDGKARPVTTDAGEPLEPAAATGRGPSGDETKAAYYQRELDLSSDEALDLINTPISDGLGGNPRTVKINQFAKRKADKNAVKLYGMARDAIRAGKDPAGVRKKLLDMGLDPAKAGL